MHTWKRFWVAIAGAVFFALMGFGMRFAEDSQVGYTHDASMWVFVVAGLFAYYAGIVCFTLLKNKNKKEVK